MKATFITGNPNKAEFFKKYADLEVDHHKLDLDEIQSLDLVEVVTHKALQAYKVLQRPVFVEDVSLELSALGRLPGTFIKHFIDEIGLEAICRLADPFDNRSAIGKTAYGYCDENGVQVFEGAIYGTIPEHPQGDSGFGWDPIFIPEGYTQSRAQLNEDDYQKVYLQIKPIKQLADFLKSH
jgi:non-canonical purine NTP pyrophosphatase (RdgB/HAM1 family)